MSESTPFKPNSRHQLLPGKANAKDGGVPKSGDSTDVVICDLDKQPHYLDCHVSTGGRSPKCEGPMKWGKRGVQIDDVPLDF